MFEKMPKLTVESIYYKGQDVEKLCPLKPVKVVLPN